MQTKAEAMKDVKLRRIIKDGADWSSAEEIRTNEIAVNQTATSKWLRDLPALKTRALAVYEAEVAKGDKNAAKRGTRKAREIWGDFSA